MTQFWYHIALEGPAISAGGHRTGITRRPPRVQSCRVRRGLYLHKSDHTKCSGVYIFNSKYLGKKSKSNRHWILYKKTEIESRGENDNCHITSAVVLSQFISWTQTQHQVTAMHQIKPNNLVCECESTSRLSSSTSTSASKLQQFTRIRTILLLCCRVFKQSFSTSSLVVFDQSLGLTTSTL